jgi:hypothetical protein
VVPGFVSVDPRYYGNKYDRAQAMAFLQHSGNVWLPSVDLAPWVESYVTNMFRFPAPPDDDTDASSQAWRRLASPAPALDPKREAAQEAHALQRRKLAALRQQVGQIRLSRTNA